jgi:outer membrane protein assembly factor BamB
MNAILLSLLLGAGPAPAESWPGFRGDGTSRTTAANLPVRWSPTENVAWRTPLPGYGQSSPVVWNDRVFVTAIDGSEKEKLFVVAVDVKSGKAVWTKEFAATQKGKNNPMMSRAAPTPVVDGNAVYAFFESGDVIALSHAGEVKWQRSLSKDYGAFKNNHGVGSSPAQSDKMVLILVDDLGPSYLVALDKATGKNVWMADRTSRASWTSPVVATLNEKPAVLVSSSGSLTAYDAATGTELATLDGLVGNNIPSPVVAGDLIVLGAGENRMKPDLAASAKSNCCVRLTAKGDKTAFELVWDGTKAVCHHASPLVHQGHVYFVTKTGVVHCVDLRTGEERYSERLDNPCWATPVGAGDHVYFFGKDGVTTVLKAGPEFVKVAANRFWSPADFAKRRDEAKDKAAATLPKPPEGKGPGGGPPLPKDELEATRYSAVGDVVYGVAAVDGTFVVRTGTELICVREPRSAKHP